VSAAITEGDIGDVVSAVGTLTISDIDGDDAPTFVNVEDKAGDNGFGKFTLTSGVWTYTLDQTEVQDLDPGDRATDATTFTATDGSAQRVGVTISGSNDAPIVAINLVDLSTVIGSAFNFDVSTGFFRDFDASAILTFSALKSDGSALPDWLSFNASAGIFTGISQAEDVGAVDITVTATDGNNTSALDIFTLTVSTTNESPILVNTIADQVIAEDSALSFQFSNDVFADSDVGDNVTYSAALPNGNSLPAWLSFNAAMRTFSGTPLNENVGSVDVKVTATDGSGASVSDTFNLRITNTDDDAVISGDTTGALTEGNIGDAGVVVSGTLLIADIDADDAPSFANVGNTTSDGGYGNFVLTEGVWTYTLNQFLVQDLDVGDELTDTTIFTATDGSTQQVRITITGADDAPLISGNVLGAVIEGNIGDAAVTASGTLAITDIDTDDTPSFSDVASKFGDNGLGSFVLTDENWTYSLDQAQVQTLDQGDQITDSTTFTATDGSTQQVSVIITGTNDAPTVATALLDKPTLMSSTFNFDVNVGFFNDLDADDTLTFSAIQADGSALPRWLSFDTNTGVFTGSSQEENLGAIDITVTATDSSNTAVSDTFTLAVRETNRAPTLENVISDQVIAEDSDLSFQFSADVFVDSDVGDNLGFTATLLDGSALPAWLTFNGATRTFSGTPLNENVGSIDIKVTATDGSGASVSDAFNLSVY